MVSDGVDGWDDVMWCHACETWQLRGDMPTRDYWRNGKPVRVCVACRDEPEDVGVWEMDRRVAAYGGAEPCWREHAERRDAFYPGDCGHAGRSPAASGSSR